MSVTTLSLAVHAKAVSRLSKLPQREVQKALQHLTDKGSNRHSHAAVDRLLPDLTDIVDEVICGLRLTAKTSTVYRQRVKKRALAFLSGKLIGCEECGHPVFLGAYCDQQCDYWSTRDRRSIGMKLHREQESEEDRINRINAMRSTVRRRDSFTTNALSDRLSAAQILCWRQRTPESIEASNIARRETISRKSPLEVLMSRSRAVAAQRKSMARRTKEDTSASAAKSMRTREENGTLWAHHEYTFRNGDTVTLQGYEPEAAAKLESLDWAVCKASSSELPTIFYRRPRDTAGSRLHSYHPDLLVSRGNVKAVVEVKSTWTLANPRDWDTNIAKYRAATLEYNKKGLDFWVVVYYPKSGVCRTSLNPKTSNDVEFLKRCPE